MFQNKKSNVQIHIFIDLMSKPGKPPNQVNFPNIQIIIVVWI